MADLNCDWGYLYDNGPSDWGKLCNEICDNGAFQSPINLEVNSFECDDADLELKTATLNVNKYYNNGHTVQLNVDSGQELTLKGETYTLKQMHFHIPSEHTINGKQTPGCYHLVHESNTNPGEYAVIEVMLEVADSDKETNTLKSILNNIPTAKDEEVLLTSINTKELVPSTLNAYNYKGSFTTPPCTESVEWLVSPNSLYVTKEHIKALHEIIQVGVRPAQNIYDRSIQCASGDHLPASTNYLFAMSSILSSLFMFHLGR